MAEFVDVLNDFALGRILIGLSLTALWCAGVGIVVGLVWLLNMWLRPKKT